MKKVFRNREANWQIEVKDYDSCTVKLDGNIVVEGIKLEETLTFIRKWHEPVVLTD